MIFDSPRIAALGAAPSANDIALFWKQLEADGAPIVEPDPDDEARRLVTFVWRASHGEDVAILNGPAGFGGHHLVALGDTDIRYLTLSLPADSRATYAFLPNPPDPFPTEVADLMPLIMRAGNDPLNVKSIPMFTKDPEAPINLDITVAVMELEGAPAQPWWEAREGVPRGEVTRTDFHSDLLDNDRRVFVYMPPGYEDGAAPYPLVVAFDGFMIQHDIPLPTILDNLIADGAVPPMVGVLVDNPPPAFVTRMSELSCNREFLSMLTEELLPSVRKRYRITDDPARTIVTGASLGGLCSSFVALRRPDVFGNVLSLSGSYWWGPGTGPDDAEWLTHEYAVAPDMPRRVYMDVGRFETGTPPNGGPDMVVTNRHLHDVLLARGVDVERRLFSGGHTTICWRGTIADGLRHLTRGW